MLYCISLEVNHIKELRVIFSVIVYFHSGGSNGGFFLAFEDFGRMLDNSFPTSAFFFFEVDISSRTLIPLFRPGSVYSVSMS